MTESEMIALAAACAAADPFDAADVMAVRSGVPMGEPAPVVGVADGGGTMEPGMEPGVDGPVD